MTAATATKALATDTNADSSITIFDKPVSVEQALARYIEALDELIVEAEAIKTEFVKDLKKMDLAQALRGDRAEKLKESGLTLRFAEHIKKQILDKSVCTSEDGYNFMDNRVKALENNLKNTASSMACKDAEIKLDATDLYRAYQRILSSLTAVHFDMFDAIYPDA